MEEQKEILVRALQDWQLKDGARTIDLKKGQEVMIPFRMFQRLIELKVVVPGGMHFSRPVRMYD